MDLELVTSRYHSPLVPQAITERDLVAIGITVGPPRFLKYELAATLGALAPHGLMQLEGDEFDEAYLRRFAGFGAAAIEVMLSAVASTYRASGAVLLCYEKVELGEHCHRTLCAEWFERETGQAVPELTAAQLQLT
jgi:hypothetical protein